MQTDRVNQRAVLLDRRAETLDDLARAKAEFDSEAAKVRVESRRDRHETRGRLRMMAGLVQHGSDLAATVHDLDGMLDDL